MMTQDKLAKKSKTKKKQ